MFGEKHCPNSSLNVLKCTCTYKSDAIAIFVLQKYIANTVTATTIEGKVVRCERNETKKEREKQNRQRN